jgi:GxxExxY protein
MTSWSLQHSMFVNRFVLTKFADQVMRSLGNGHSEKVYHQAMITHLRRHNISHQSEVICPYYYMDECVGFGQADLVVNNIVVEIKAKYNVPRDALLQLRKYSNALSRAECKPYEGLLINFNQKSNMVNSICLEAGDI